LLVIGGGCGGGARRLRRIDALRVACTELLKQAVHLVLEGH
jgi:hypothetical protein